MKTVYGYPCILAIVMLVAVSVFFAGCASQPAKQPATQTAMQTVMQTAPQTVIQPAGQTTPVTSAGTLSASLPYGVTMSYPGTWKREDVVASGERDYGRTTLNIANFSSPFTIPGDTASYNILSIDLDKDPGTDFEGYFNKATLAVGKAYDTGDQGIIKSSTLYISGYKSYEMDFESRTMRGSYIFTSTKNGMYIFAFRGPNKPVPVQTLQAEKVDMYKSIRISP
jgi:hypothetical protein